MGNLKIYSKIFQSRKKISFYLMVMLILSLGLSLSFQSLLALTLSPVKNPPAGNVFRRNGLINEGVHDYNVLSKAPMGVLRNFQVGTKSFFVRPSDHRVSIGTLFPNTTLTVAGRVRVGNFPNAGRPGCDSGLIGSIYYDTDVNRPFVCTNTGWLYF